MQPLRRREAKVEFGFVQYGLTVPGDVDSGQATAVDQSAPSQIQFYVLLPAGD